jgi:hypothetical protein
MTVSLAALRVTTELDTSGYARGAKVKTDADQQMIASDTQRWLKAQALQLASAMEGTRWRLVQEGESKTPFVVVVLVIFWFITVFASFGLFAPRNMMAIATILLCSLGVGSAIRMITELHLPFEGLVRVSSAPLALALEAISRYGSPPSSPPLIPAPALITRRRSARKATGRPGLEAPVLS